jgi:Kef-type K+ transport system membrane component KefB
MHNVWFIASAWMGIAFLASLISIRLGVSVALIEILLGVAAGNAFGIKSNEWVNFLATFGAGLLTARTVFRAGRALRSVRAEENRALKVARTTQRTSGATSSAIVPSSLQGRQRTAASEIDP